MSHQMATPVDSGNAAGSFSAALLLLAPLLTAAVLRVFW